MEGSQAGGFCKERPYQVSPPVPACPHGAREPRRISGSQPPRIGCLGACPSNALFLGRAFVVLHHVDMNKTFRPWNVYDVWLLPPSVHDLVPERHAAHFIRDLVRHELDLSPGFTSHTERRGYPPYHPAMMVALLLYAYSRGVHSSRRIVRRCEERVDFMAVTANPAS